jgi:hypothetical protein
MCLPMNYSAPVFEYRDIQPAVAQVAKDGVKA